MKPGMPAPTIILMVFMVSGGLMLQSGAVSKLYHLNVRIGLRVVEV